MDPEPLLVLGATRPAGWGKTLAPAPRRWLPTIFKSLTFVTSSAFPIAFIETDLGGVFSLAAETSRGHSS